MSQHDQTSVWNPPDANGEAETYELGEDGNLIGNQTAPIHTKRYRDGNTIDWFYEDFKEREREEGQRALRGARGILVPFFDSMRMWLVVVGTGIGIGLAGAWLDVLVKCGFGPGECLEWQSWSEYLDVKHIFVESVLQISIYVTLAVRSKLPSPLFFEG
ncbi:chloride channel [Marasmius sp. AFHP31]|nr:chloride channel [Marasmius sp. AFHP31]